MSISGLTLKQLSTTDLKTALSGASGLGLNAGPFIIRIRTPIGAFADNFRDLYGEFPVFKSVDFADFQVELERPRTIRWWLKPQVLFRLEGLQVFEPFPEDTAFPLFEWGLNWCVGHRAHQFLMLHAATLERGGAGILLPALPGSGKSTLCAAMALSGWRYMSDEFGLFDFEQRKLIALPRPAALKNESLRVIREFAKDSFIGRLYPKTRKGTVGHLRPPDAAIKDMAIPAKPGFVIFPRYLPGAPVTLKSVHKSQAFLRLAQNSFNYELTGADGFLAVNEIIRAVECVEVSYSKLDEVLVQLDKLTAC